MGILHEIAKREQERDELLKYLAFWNVPTRKRDSKEQRLHEVENELRVLRHPAVDMSDDRMMDEQIHVQ
ncbi:hypothetical protein [Gorillibacterium sp. sgz5001074]|uniref:hypothetical protein n=1 Tax=Gorillibacterium sp. sgz5001074 TaxID=3446695 RepID=UPI003F68012B